MTYSTHDSRIARLVEPPNPGERRFSNMDGRARAPSHRILEPGAASAVESAMGYSNPGRPRSRRRCSSGHGPCRERDLSRARRRLGQHSPPTSVPRFCLAGTNVQVCRSAHSTGTRRGRSSPISRPWEFCSCGRISSGPRTVRRRPRGSSGSSQTVHTESGSGLTRPFPSGTSIVVGPVSDSRTPCRNCASEMPKRA
jgi:hypothetical protein